MPDQYNTGDGTFSTDAFEDYGITDEGTEEEPENKQYEPFDGAEGTNTALLITNMRILDVLYALYAEENDDKADALINAHARGKILGSMPQLEL